MKRRLLRSRNPSTCLPVLGRPVRVRIQWQCLLQDRAISQPRWRTQRVASKTEPFFGSRHWYAPRASRHRRRHGCPVGSPAVLALWSARCSCQVLRRLPRFQIIPAQSVRGDIAAARMPEQGPNGGDWVFSGIGSARTEPSIVSMALGQAARRKASSWTSHPRCGSNWRTFG